jgi:ubiquinone/menaquinone biosynthesis C-methylase UbiE
MAYYDNIAKQWHGATGFKGGAFKEFVLNEILLHKLSGIHHCSILELGAGNGYFLPLVLHRFSGQVPAAIMITDQSGRLLEIAKKYFRIPAAEYETLDVRQPFPFTDNQFDLILASMIFNEVSTGSFQKALRECKRVLSNQGLLLIAVVHPKFVSNLQKRELLARTKEGVLTMPGSGSLRVPVVMRSSEVYRSSLKEVGFEFEEEEIFPTTEVLNIKSGLQKARKVPLALVFKCTKSSGNNKASQASEEKLFD